MKDNVIKKLSEREHAIHRPGMYVGSVKLAKQEGYILENGKIQWKEYEYCGGLLKIINEIIDNSLDEAIRTKFTYANKIQVKISKDTVEVQDNGRGIPSTIEPVTNLPASVVAFTHARAGANFDDVERVTAGTNGVGSFCTAVYSSSFIVHTINNNEKLILTCKNNLEKYDYSTRKVKSDSGTIVKFKPDFSRFEQKELNETHINLIHQRVCEIAASYPQIQWKFNGTVIRQKNARDFVKMFSDVYKMVETDNYFIAVTPNDFDDFKQVSIVNGLKTINGGSHIDYVSWYIVDGLFQKLQRKYKTIKRGDIKNKLQFIVVMKGFPNCEFDSQTKEKLTNSGSDIGKFFKDTDLREFGKKLYCCKEILEPIIEIFELKKALKEKQALRDLNKTLKKSKVRSDKYLAPTKESKYFVICEGDSAKGGISSVLGRKEFGYFAARGVPLNVQKSKVQRIIKNEELKTIMQILNIQIGHEELDWNFENVVFAMDADLDASHIIGLYLGFFQKYAKKQLKMGKIKRLITPIIILKNKQTEKIEKYFFDLNSYNKYLKENPNHKYKPDYKKGLGSWEKEELIQVFGNNIDSFIETFEYDEKTDTFINNWVGDTDSENRKQYLRNNEFSLFKL